MISDKIFLPLAIASAAMCHPAHRRSSSFELELENSWVLKKAARGMRVRGSSSPEQASPSLGNQKFIDKYRAIKIISR